MHKTVWTLAAPALALVAGCAAPGDAKLRSGLSQIAATSLIEASPLAAGAMPEDLSQIDILEVTPEMATFLNQHMEGASRPRTKLGRLIYAVMKEGKFQLVYDDTTRTARETFQDQRGNCLSFTNMFIAMARYLGIDVRYQEVDIPPDWSLAGDTFLFTQHVNVRVNLGAEEVRIVDFNIYDFDSAYERRVISDERARAHYFSNIGVDQMLAGHIAGAYTNFRQAVLEDSSFAPAWINLGILHRRENFPAHAEAAYLQALKIDRFDAVAMSNLATLYAEEGLTEKAQIYRKRVQTHRKRNPYYRYRQAQQAVGEGDYRAAIGHLKYAIRKRDQESRFYSLLSISYLMSGDQAAAQRWMRKAEGVAANENDRQRYHHKLQWLMSQGGRG